ncbi:MAG TPA: zf-HC2 domain-containing protein [Candidatus Didemnitutus sp.]|nr:zf-HC2 domain-containing protein [Candidatus Didemnitutus sp.]
MNCQRVQELFLDYQDGQLAPDESAQVRTHLSSCPTCQREWAALQEITRKLEHLPAETPSPRLREQFYAMLDTHQREADAPSPFALAKSRIDRFFETLLPARPVLQFAFSVVLLFAGLVAGARFLAKPTPVVVDEKSKQELVDLRRQVDDMGKLVAVSLLQQKSTSERMQAVLATLDLKSPDRKTLTDLVGVLSVDNSVNVRLAAVEALSPHISDNLVRAGLLSALPRESAPLVQVAMIELLTTAREPEAVAVFDRLARDEAADKNVREAARRGLAVLRTPPPNELPTNANTKEPSASKV